MGKHPINLAVYLLLPAIIIAINVSIGTNAIGILPEAWEGVNLNTATIVVWIMVMFQFFSTSLAYDLSFDDFRTDRRWRLLAAPIALRKYMVANVASALIISIISGLVLLAVGRFVFDAYLFNIGITLGVLVISAIMAMAVGCIFFLVCSKKGTAEGLAHAVVWPQTLPLQFLGALVNDGGPIEFLFTRATPYAVAINAINYSSPLAGDDMNMAFLNLGVLAAMAAVLWVVVFIISRKKAF